jgi:hypothetical protein
MLAMNDEIDEPGAAGTLYKETLALQLLIQIARCRLSTDHSTGEGWAVRIANCVGPSNWSKQTSPNHLRRMTSLLVGAGS